MSRAQPADPSRDPASQDPPTSQNVLDSIVEQGRLGENQYERERGKDSLRVLASEVVSGNLSVQRDVEATLNQRIAQLDELIGGVINDILHHPEFQKLESSWRGLARLVNRTSQYNRVVIRFLTITPRELQRSEARPRLNALTSFESLDTRGGRPFSLLIGDYEFTPTDPGACSILFDLARVASLARAPFIAAAQSSLLGISALNSPPLHYRIPPHFESDEAVRWRSFRRHESSRYLVLALPRFMVRKPYNRTWAAGRYSQEEKVDGSDSNNILWSSPVWIIAAQTARAFGQGSWCGDVGLDEYTSVDSSLPYFSGWDRDGAVRNFGPLEMSASDSLVSALRDEGLTCLTQDSSDHRVVISDITTAHDGRTSDDSDTRRPVMLRDVLAASRIEQYLKTVAREARSWIETPAQLQRYLMQWVAEHSTGAEPLDPASPAQAAFQRGLLRVIFPDQDQGALVRIDGAIVANINSRCRSELAVSIPVLLHAPGSPPREPWVRRLASRPSRPAVDPSRAASSSAVPTGPSYDAFAKCLDLLERTALLQRKKLLENSVGDGIQNLLLKKMAAVLGVPEKEPSPREQPSPEPSSFWTKYSDAQTRPRIESGPNPSPAAPRQDLAISFDSLTDPSAADYSTFFGALSDLNALLLSVTPEGNAASRDLLIARISKSSPGGIYASTVAAVAQSFAQIFTIGHQVTEWKLASVRAQEAKLELAKKELEFEDIKRRTQAKWATGELDEEIEVARKKAELADLKKKQDEAVRERRKLMLDDLSQRYDLLTKALPLLSTLPPDMQDDFKQDLVLRLDSLQDTPLRITAVHVENDKAKAPVQPAPDASAKKT